MNKTSWCKQNGISDKSFFYWQRKLRLEAAETNPLPTAQSTEASVPTFVELKLMANERTEVPMDNNASERAIRDFCIGRKNWQMIDTVNGTRSSAIIYSIAETAKANNLKSYDYFVYLLEEISNHMDDTDRYFLDDLLPWSQICRTEFKRTDNQSCLMVALNF